MEEIIDVNENEETLIELPKYSGKLESIIKLNDGTKRIIYDGVDCAISDVVLTDAELAEVEWA